MNSQRQKLVIFLLNKSKTIMAQNWTSWKLSIINQKFNFETILFFCRNISYWIKKKLWTNYNFPIMSGKANKNLSNYSQTFNFDIFYFFFLNLFSGLWNFCTISLIKFKFYLLSTILFCLWWRNEILFLKNTRKLLFWSIYEHN